MDVNKRWVKQDKNKIIIGTWNVRTLLHLGKMQELAEQISKPQLLEILAIQEIRWSETSLIKKNYSLYYSGHSSKSGQAGTGFILLKKMQNYVIGFEP
jgi:exonuclease III